MYPNLNILRFFAASLVIVGHAYAFRGLPEPLVLSWIKLGPLGVLIFFTISGYLLAESWRNDRNLMRFLVRRCIRIFPALVVCIILTVFVIGPLLTSYSMYEYFSNKYTYAYLGNIALRISFYLPGVFEHNVIPNAVNGSLWSLPIECCMYLILSIIGSIKIKDTILYSILLLIWMFGNVFWAERETEMFVVYYSDIRQVFFVGIYFWVGAVYSAWGLKRFFSLPIACIILLVAFILPSNPQVVKYLSLALLPYIVLSFGLSHPLPIAHKISDYGDFSYGMYIYACPIQQFIVSISSDIPYTTYVFYTFLCTMPLAIMSWVYIEKPAMRFKPYKTK